MDAVKRRTKEGRKNVIVTGSSRGIGRGIAEKYASEGYHLFLCGRDGKALSETAGDIAQKYNNQHILSFAADLSDKTQAKLFGNWLLEQDISIDILVNNAGDFLPGSIHNEEEGVLEKMIGGKFV